MWGSLGGGNSSGGSEEVGPEDMLAEGVEGGEVEGGAEAGPDDGREGAAPELAEGIWSAGDATEGLQQGGGVGLLDAGLEEIGGLEEGGGEDAGTEAGDEVECWDRLVLKYRISVAGMVGSGFTR